MLNDVQFGHHVTRSGLHQVTARAGDKVVGGLQWHADHDPEIGVRKGEIATVAVLPEHQGQGLATGMLRHAWNLSDSGQGIPRPEHSSSRSQAGSGWAAKTGGKIPKNSEPQSPFSAGSTRSLVSSMARS